MGNAGSRGFQDGVVSKKEMERMHRRFQRLANSSGKMALDDFQTLPELQGNLLTPRIFQLFDANGDGYLDKEEFSQAIEQLGRPCTEKEKAAFAFKLYDLDGDGFVGRSDILSVLRLIMGKALSQTQLEQIVAATVATHDRDGDGRLSEREFRRLLAASDETSKSMSVC